MLPSLSHLRHSLNIDAKRQREPTKREIDAKEFVAIVMGNGKVNAEKVFAYTKDSTFEITITFVLDKTDHIFGIDTLSGYPCVSVTLSSEFQMNVTDLFFDIGEHRTLCEIETLTRKVDGKLPEIQKGDLVLKVLDFIAFKNRMSITLSDASKFNGKPFRWAPNDSMTDILSLSRGYGFYTSRGFVSTHLVRFVVPGYLTGETDMTVEQFDKLLEVSNMDLGWIFLCATTPFSELSDKISQFNFSYNNTAGFKMSVDKNIETAKNIKQICPWYLENYSMRHIFYVVNQPDNDLSSEFVKLAKDVIDMWESLYLRNVKLSDGTQSAYPGMDLTKVFLFEDEVVGMHVVQEQPDGVPRFEKQKQYRSFEFWVDE